MLSCLNPLFYFSTTYHSSFFNFVFPIIYKRDRGRISPAHICTNLLIDVCWPVWERNVEFILIWTHNQRLVAAAPHVPNKAAYSKLVESCGPALDCKGTFSTQLRPAVVFVLHQIHESCFRLCKPLLCTSHRFGKEPIVASSLNRRSRFGQQFLRSL